MIRLASKSNPLYRDQDYKYFMLCLCSFSNNNNNIKVNNSYFKIALFNLWLSYSRIDTHQQVCSIAIMLEPMPI